MVGKNVSGTYAGLKMGSEVRFGGATWHVVGVFDAGGSAFDSEVWADAHVLNQVYKRPDNIFQSVTVHLTSPDAIQQFKDAVTADPRMNVDVDREVNYYSKQSQTMTTIITTLGGIVAVIMAIGAVFGALNTMYSAVSERSREIATLRALGFGAGSVVFSFTLEALADFFRRRRGWLPGGSAAQWPDHRSNELADLFPSGFCLPDHAPASGSGHHLCSGHGTDRRIAAGDSGGSPSGGSGPARTVIYPEAVA